MYYISLYDVWFKSYDTPSIRVAAILDLSNMATRGQYLLVSLWFLRGPSIKYYQVETP